MIDNYSLTVILPGLESNALHAVTVTIFFFF